MRPALLRALPLVALLAGCAVPPPDAYVGGSARSTGGAVALGKNTAGEACTQQGSADAVDVFCGTWDQPSGHVATLRSSAADPLSAIATGSPWRTGLDERFACADPTPTTVIGAPALLLACTRKVGGWPQAALVTRIDGRTYVADGILPSLPVIERGIAVLSGRASPADAAAIPPGQADALMASRLAAQSFSAGDIGQYQALMVAGTRANLAENYTGAERAYRAALALQQKALGPNDAATAVPLMLIALQLSDQGRTVDAAANFDRAARLTGAVADPFATARLAHYRGLNAINEDRAADALPLLTDAERRYGRLLSPDLLAARPPRAAASLAGDHRASVGEELADTALIPPDQQAALIGVIETRRYQAIALRQLGRSDEARALLQSATQLSTARGLRQRDLTARLARTTAMIADSASEGTGISDMDRASRDFDQAQPGTRPVAQTLLLRAAQANRNRDTGAALPLCRRAAELLTELKSGTEAALIAPCLDAFAAEAERRPADRPALLAEMFGLSQLVQGSITARQIALASARLTENARNPQVGDAIRRQQDSSLAVADLQSRLDLAAAAVAAGRTVRETPENLAQQLTAARALDAEADAALQTAAPNYGQLVQQVATAGQVLAALSPGEAFVSMALTPDAGWVFVLRDGRVEAVRSRIGTVQASALVARVRKTVELGTDGTPPPFDTDAARTLYAGLFGAAAPLLEGAEALTIVPTGALLSLPFEVLLTGPADPANLAVAPWLMQRFAITHVPAAANFVSLRRAATRTAGRQPWYGFGDFRPVTPQQAAATFPTASCTDSARLFAGLPLLPFAGRELTAARQIMGAPANDELLGPAFTTPAVLKQDLRGVRVLHFATHALLPTDLRCQNEPAIVTSGVTGAPTANAALLTASDVTAMQLDADVVILSACNSGGPNGSTSGESLSGLARAFFYAGARAMLVTHWSVNDQATALLVAGTLARLKAGDPLGLAGAFQHTQQSMLADAGKSLPAAIAHPFYWAPFTLVGEGRGRSGMARS